MKGFALKLWHRVLIVAVTSSLPLLLISSYLINISVSKDIQFTVKEIGGSKFLRPLELLLDLIPKYQAEVLKVAAGDAAAGSNVQLLKGRIDSAVALVTANCNEDLGRMLGFKKNSSHGNQTAHPLLSGLAADWEGVRNSPRLGPDWDKSTEKLVKTLQLVIAHTGDCSNLILDRDLDSFYLVEINLNILPQTQQRTADCIFKVGNWIRRDEREAHASQIAVIAALLRNESQDRIARAGRTALNSVSSSHGTSMSLQTNLPPAINRYISANNAFLDILDGMVGGNKPSVSQFEEAGWRAHSEAYRLWEASAKELDLLLAARVEGYRSQEYQEFAGIAATILFTVLAVWLVSMEVDITDRKETESRLQGLKNHLASIIDSMPAALIGLNTDGTVNQWNRQAETLTGRSAANALGQAIHSLLPDFDTSIKTLEDKAKKGGTASLENVYLEKEGERCVFDLMLYRLVAAGIEGAVLRIEDVTERQRVQAMIVQSEKMMSLGGLAAGMAHEINNPLGIISLAAQNIQRRVSQQLPANQKAGAELGISLELMGAYFKRRGIDTFLQDIQEASSRAARIIANILQFSRKSGTDRQWVRLSEIMDQTVELAANDYDLRKRFDFRTITITREYQADVPEVSVVVVEIQQVLLNLIKNAAQAMAEHTDERGNAITLRIRRVDKYAVLEVEDNGPGIDDVVQRRVFEPFFTTKSPGVGTGLGLSVSYTIITENHQGFISVHSSPGHGAKFVVKLPIHTRIEA